MEPERTAVESSSPFTTHPSSLSTAKNNYLAQTVLAIWKETGLLGPLERQISSLLLGTLAKADGKKRIGGVEGGRSTRKVVAGLFGTVGRDLVLDYLCTSGLFPMASLFLESTRNGTDDDDNAVDDLEEAWVINQSI